MNSNVSRLLFAVTLLFAFPALLLAQTNNETTKAGIRAVIDAQAAAWNRGDVEGYMDGYDRSPKTEFVGGDSITRGWQQVLDRYKQKYR